MAFLEAFLAPDLVAVLHAFVLAILRAVLLPVGAALVALRGFVFEAVSVFLMVTLVALVFEFSAFDEFVHVLAGRNEHFGFHRNRIYFDSFCVFRHE